MSHLEDSTPSGGYMISKYVTKITIFHAVYIYPPISLKWGIIYIPQLGGITNSIPPNSGLCIFSSAIYWWCFGRKIMYWIYPDKWDIYIVYMGLRQAICNNIALRSPIYTLHISKIPQIRVPPTPSISN